MGIEAAASLPSRTTLLFLESLNGMPNILQSKWSAQTKVSSAGKLTDFERGNVPTVYHLTIEKLTDLTSSIRT